MGRVPVCAYVCVCVCVHVCVCVRKRERKRKCVVYVFKSILISRPHCPMITCRAGFYRPVQNEHSAKLHHNIKLVLLAGLVAT